MPVRPRRPSIGEINRALRERPEQHWIDRQGRVYGFMNNLFTKYMIQEGAIEPNENHAWVLLPRTIAVGAKYGEYAVFPLPGDTIDLRPYVRPLDRTRMRIRIIAYLYRPRRQRAVGIIVEQESL